jgi:hypothetical protein
MASPSSLVFTNAGAAYDQTVTVTQSGSPAGPFSAVSNNTGVVTVAQGSGPSAFVVTPVNAGNTTITITGSNAMTAAVAINVTSTSITVQKDGEK